MPRAEFLVGGMAPAPKGSRTWLGGGRSKESSDRCKPWVDLVSYVARQQRPNGETLTPAYSIELDFRMPRPSRPKYDWPTRDGDLDKLERACLDGMVQGGLLVDDRHVIRLASSKQFVAERGGIATGVYVTVL